MLRRKSRLSQMTNAERREHAQKLGVSLDRLDNPSGNPNRAELVRRIREEEEASRGPWVRAATYIGAGAAVMAAAAAVATLIGSLR